MSLVDIMKRLDEGGAASNRTFNISILRNITIEPLAPYLRDAALQLDLNANVNVGDFDTISKDALGANTELMNADTDAIVVFCNFEQLAPQLASRLSSLNDQDIQDEIERTSNWFADCINGLRSQCDAPILWCGLERRSFPATGISDSQEEYGETGIIRALNAALSRACGAVANAYLVDLDLCCYRVGRNNFYDARYWYTSKFPYTPQAMEEISAEIFKFIRPLLGLNKKCLVLDCDNTLWGGVIGEDGLHGIALGQEFPGSLYRDLQHDVVNLYNQGVIIALCSKNNADDVFEVFDKHPEMVLTRDHIAAWQINWNNKVDNLYAIAKELNIGADSLVFVDDSEFEIELVNTHAPEITTIHLPKKHLAKSIDVLRSATLFGSLSQTQEDRARGQMYRDEADRKDLERKSTDLTGYLKSLEMELEIGLCDVTTIKRVAQQTQKTNQFNLTTKRYSEVEIEKLAESDRHDVLWARLKDRFGDYGIIGSAIVEYEEDAARIDTFLLSCRALGRGVENAFIGVLGQRAAARGAKHLIGKFSPTKKNEQVSQFYPGLGFKGIGHQAGTDEYCADIHETMLEPPSFFGTTTKMYE